MAPYVPLHLRAQRSVPRAVLAGGDAEPSQGGAETKEIEEEERPSASRVARGPSADNFGVRKAQSNGRLQQRARFDAVLDELSTIRCPSLRADCEAGCEAERARRAAEEIKAKEIKAWRCSSMGTVYDGLDVAALVQQLLDVDGRDAFVRAASSLTAALTDDITREIDFQSNLWGAPACVADRIRELMTASIAAAIAMDEGHQRRERQEREAEAEAAEAAAEAAAAAELAELIGFAKATVASDERAVVMEEQRAAAEAEVARLVAEAEAERVTKAERAAAAAAAAAAEAERAVEAAQAQRKMSALAQPAAEGVSPYDAAGIDQAPPGYSSVGSSGAPPSLSPLSPVLPLGCASVFCSGLGAWLRFGWDPGGAGVMRGCEQRSAAACA